MKTPALEAVGHGDLAVALALGAIGGAGLGWGSQHFDTLVAHVVHSVAGGWLVAVAWLLAVTDLRTHRLPDRLILAGAAVTVPATVMAAGIDQQWWIPVIAIGCGLAATAVLVVASFATRGAIGRGDLKLTVLTGYWLGLLHPLAPAWGLVAGLVLGGLGALVTVMVGRATLRDYIALGPGLLAGTAVTTVAFL